MVDEGPGADFRWLLHTADAHDMYAAHGFLPGDATFMERPAPTPDRDRQVTDPCWPSARRVSTMTRWPSAVARSRVCSPRRSRPSPCSGPPAPRAGDPSRSGPPNRLAPSSGPAPAPYYAEVAAFTASLDRENTALDEEMNDAIATTAPRAVGDLFARVTRESADRLDERLVDLDALDPPAEAADVHSALVAASATLAEESRTYAGALAGVHADDLGSVEAPDSFVAAEAAVDDACAQLQALADSAGAEVDLCVGLFAPPA